MKLLEEKVVMITGASGGLGAATAALFAAQGARLLLVGRDERRLQQVQQQIEAKVMLSPSCLVADLSESASTAQLAHEALQACGRIDILVNNAAVVEPIQLCVASSIEHWQRLFAINVFAVQQLTAAMLPAMHEQGWGRIINVSSGAAVMNIRGLAAYNASKAALERMTATLAAEIEGSGVIASLFRPGQFASAMQQQLRTAPADAFPEVGHWRENFKRGGLRSPEVPARGLLWLASRFGDQHNGRTLDITDAASARQIEQDLQKAQVEE